MIKINLDREEYSGILKPKSSLFPKIWKNNRINPIVARKLMQIADDVIRSLELDVDQEDVIITGSIASYNWHNKSDIDLHIMYDYRKINDDVELVKKMFDQTRINWNKKHNIMIAGKEVEIYFQDASEAHEANGIWSLELEKWLAVPVKLNPEIDSVTASKKADAIAKSIDHLFDIYKEKKYKEVYEYSKKIKKKISNMRKSGLDQEGIFSPENIAFKMLRNSGNLEKLSALKITAYDMMMSLRLETTKIDENKTWRNYLVKEDI